MNLLFTKTLERSRLKPKCLIKIIYKSCSIYKLVWLHSQLGVVEDDLVVSWLGVVQPRQLGTQLTWRSPRRLGSWLGVVQPRQLGTQLTWCSPRQLGSQLGRRLGVVQVDLVVFLGITEKENNKRWYNKELLISHLILRCCSTITNNMLGC